MTEIQNNKWTENPNLSLNSLNRDIFQQEVENTVYRVKLHEASGVDGAPAEVLLYKTRIHLLYKIISYCFLNGEVPSE